MDVCHRQAQIMRRFEAYGLDDTFVDSPALT